MAKFVTFRTHWVKPIEEYGMAVDVDEIVYCDASIKDGGTYVFVSPYNLPERKMIEIKACEHITDVVAKINAARAEDRS